MGHHGIGKNLKYHFFQTFTDQIDFFYKAKFISMSLLYMQVEDELMNTNFTAQNWTFLIFWDYPYCNSHCFTSQELQGPNVYSK